MSRDIRFIELVGGPLDGQQVAIETHRREYPIALCQRAGTAPMHIPEGAGPNFETAYYRPLKGEWDADTFYWEAP